MSKPPDASHKSEQPPSGGCGGCGYDLAGLSDDVPCPECNLPAALARARPAILAIKPDILMQVRTGMLIIGWAWPIMVMLELAHEWLLSPMWLTAGISGYWTIRSMIVPLIFLGASFGLWRAALLMRESKVPSIRWTAAATRFIALLSIPALTLGWFLSFTGVIGLLRGRFDVAGLLHTLWFVGTWITLPLVLRDASRRLEAPRLQWWSTRLAVFCMLWAGGFEGLVMTLLRLGVIPQSALVSASWQVSSWLAYPAYIVAGVIALRLARRLRHASDAATILRAQT